MLETASTSCAKRLNISISKDLYTFFIIISPYAVYTSSQLKVTVVCPFWTKTAFFNRAEKQGEKVIVKYTVMYNAQKVVNRAFRDAKKGKARSIYGFVARWQVRLVKALPVSWVMKIWCNQQKFDKRYANKDREV